MSVYEKLMLVQAELKVPKGQYNSFGKYKYRSCEDILEAAKPVLAKHKAVLKVGDDLVFVEGRFYIKATAVFTDVESGEAIENSALAREEDSKKGMDGSQITGTASSYARKYCLNGLFAIDDTKDADTDQYCQQVEAGKKKAAVKEHKQQVTSICCGGKARYINGTQLQIMSSNGGWYNVEQIPTNSLRAMLSDAAYQDARSGIEAVLNTRSV